LQNLLDDSGSRHAVADDYESLTSLSGHSRFLLLSLPGFERVASSVGKEQSASHGDAFSLNNAKCWRSKYFPAACQVMKRKETVPGHDEK
jgi:hypothetical protein